LEKNVKKPEKREYTLMLVPHHGQQIRSIRIPMMAVQYTVSILCLLIVFMVGIFVDYRHTLNAAGMQNDELEILRIKNSAQFGQIEQLARVTTQLQVDMERLNSLDAEIRGIVNNDDLTSTSRAGLVRSIGNYKGQGGPQVQSDINKINNLANDLQAMVPVREQSLVELKQELLARRARLEVTPSIWPTSGDVTSRFGWRSSPWGGSGDWHPGIDIANSSGTPIVATAGGEVVQSEWYGGYGNVVQISHGNGLTTVYGHNSQTLVHVGQVVQKGEMIAYMGSTGYSTGPHVHYEVRMNGTAVNPESFLK